MGVGHPLHVEKSDLKKVFCIKLNRDKDMNTNSFIIIQCSEWKSHNYWFFFFVRNENLLINDHIFCVRTIPRSAGAGADSAPAPGQIGTGTGTSGADWVSSAPAPAPAPKNRHRHRHLRCRLSLIGTGTGTGTWNRHRHRHLVPVPNRHLGTRHQMPNRQLQRHPEYPIEYRDVCFKYPAPV